MPNKQSLETSVGRRGGRVTETVQLSRAERHHRLVGLRGEQRSARSPAEDRHKGRARKSQAGGPLTQGKASGPKRGRREAVPHEREKASCSRTPPILVLARDRGGKESRKKS